ncbi:MAG TPA: sporulation protein YqfD [Eubacteriales bacterium]|nr:sporulation protein YqfD [Eubacteriales bacterium]
MSEVKSFCYFEAEGLNHGKIIKKLHLQKVVLRGVISKGVRLKFGVNASDKQKVVDLFTALNYNYKIIKYTGAAAFKDFLRYRFGLLIGAAAVIVFIAVMSGFVLDVKVNLPFRAREAADVLAEFGVRERGFNPALDSKAIEKSLLKLDGISYASVTRRGTTVFVNLVEELEKPAYDYLGTSDAVYSKKKAVVSRVIVFNGTAAVKTGDIVKRGDKLIEGIVSISGQQVASYANGEVFGKVQYTAEIALSDQYIEKTYGERKTYTVSTLFGKSGKPPESPYKTYETIEKTSVLGYIFPIFIREVTYVEVIYKTVEVSGETIEKLKGEAINKALSKMPADGVFLAAWCNVFMRDGRTVLQAVVEAEELISG